MKNLYFDGDFWLLPGDASDEAGLLLWPKGRCPIKEKPIEFREIYCRDLNCICNEVQLIAIDHTNEDSVIAYVRIKLSLDEVEAPTLDPKWSGSLEPEEVKLAFLRALDTEPAYLEHLKSMYHLIRRASKHQESIKRVADLSLRR